MEISEFLLVVKVNKNQGLGNVQIIMTVLCLTVTVSKVMKNICGLAYRHVSVLYMRWCAIISNNWM